MNQFSSTNSLSTLLYPHEDSKSPSDDHVYSREFQAMLDGLDDEDGTYMEGTGLNEDKRRRLSNNQVKALEKIFKVDNKLDPVRKATLAQELGLQPRQIAIWFQNRRARWKTKQLERDYSHLKANYETLKQNYKKLEQNKDNLISELRELKAKLEDKNTERNQSILQCNGLSGVPELSNNFGNLVETKGLSDSDSNGMLNEDTSPNFQMLIDTPALSTPRLDISSFSSSSQLNNYEEFWDSRGVSRNAYQQSWLKMEEECAFGSSEESCNIFSVDQAPSLRW